MESVRCTRYTISGYKAPPIRNGIELFIAGKLCSSFSFSSFFLFLFYTRPGEPRTGEKEKRNKSHNRFFVVDCELPFNLCDRGRKEGRLFFLRRR